MRRGFVAAAVAVAGLGFTGLVAGCSSGGTDAGEGPQIVVTTPVLGALVSELAGPEARVSVVMPNGVDPHEFSPSAKEVARLGDADLIVQNGLGLETSLQAPIARAAESGTPVFTVTDHVTLHEGDDVHEGENAHAQEEPGHEHSAEDPHVWLDPIAMRDAMAALAPVLHDELGLDLTARERALEGELTRLDTAVRNRLAAIPDGRRRIVSGHESMAYFADRYGLEIVGVLLPSLTSQAQVSAANLAALRARIEAEGVRVIFDETGTPRGVADAVARETGARVVELATHTLPDDGTYESFIEKIADTIATADAAG